MEKIIYCIDSSALIDIKFFYSRRNFPDVWNDFSQLVKDGRLISPSEVLKEIEEVDDDVCLWCKENNTMFKKIIPRQERYRLVQKIVSENPGIIKLKGTISQADPYLVALVLNERQKQANTLTRFIRAIRFIIITQEKGTRLPSACTKYNIEYLRLQELIQKENWVYIKK